MTKIFLFAALQTGIPISLYLILLHLLAGTNIVAGIFCPGPHLPSYYPVLIGLFLFLRIYVVLLPGIVLARLARSWIKNR